MQFGKCPVCDAIVSLDHTRNVLCDRCSSDKFIPYREQMDNKKYMAVALKKFFSGNQDNKGENYNMS